jgi:GTP-binding protein EngB required for normal cell division
MSGSNTEGEALSQLQVEQGWLLDKIDDLRNIGISGLVDLPQLIVCGNQSSGKSSVLEAISRVRFPVKSNICTRFATEVSLRRHPVTRFKVSIEPGPSRKSEADRQEVRKFAPEAFTNSDQLPALIEQAKNCMGIQSEKGISDDVLKIEISGPDKPELTLVDLPGLYYSKSTDQGVEGIGIARGLTEQYMKSPRSIILATVSANADYHLQEILDIAAKFDPLRDRTIGIITHPDKLEQNSEEEDVWLQIAKNEKIRLRLGWHTLQNRTFKTQEASHEYRDKNEKEFFNQGRWSTVARDCVGIDSLRRRLSGIMLKNIRHSLPELIEDVEKQLLNRQTSLTKLGPPRSTLQQQKGYLLALSSNFERITNEALNGMYTDGFFGELGNFTFIRYRGGSSSSCYRPSIE